MLKKQALLPPKLRTKPSVTLEIIAYFYSTFQTFIDRVPFYHELPLGTRRILTERNSKLTGACHSLYVLRETKGVEYPAYMMGSIELYGAENTEILQSFLVRLEPNSVLFKLLILLIGFSESASIVIPTKHCHSASIPNRSLLLRIQDLLVTMIWKYLHYQYGFQGAIRCFTSYISFILNTLRWMERGPKAEYEEIVDTVIDNVDRSLTLSA